LFFHFYIEIICQTIKLNKGEYNNEMKEDNVYFNKSTYNAFVDKDYMVTKPDKTDVAVIAPLLYENVDDIQKKGCLSIGGKFNTRKKWYT